MDGLSVADALIARAMTPDLTIGRGILRDAVLGERGRFALVSQPGPLASVDPAIPLAAAALVSVRSLAAEDLDELVTDLPAVDRVVGIGGGMTMDAAKYVAWRRDLPLVLAPSIVSVDAGVTNQIAVRRGGTVVYEGFVVADKIVADLEVIARAPARLNRAGVGDLLSIHTGRNDWARGARAGRIAFDRSVDSAAHRILEGMYALADDVRNVTDVALEGILRAYAQVNALCLRVGHAGPEEGSEHYFAYQAEAVTGRSFVHGEIVGLGTVLMAVLQENDPGRVSAFLDGCGVAWRPHALGLTVADLGRILRGLPRFVRESSLAWSVIDEAALDDRGVEALLARAPLATPAPARSPSNPAAP